MKVEIWSDIMCPFCFIGKRKFELALKDFPHKDALQIEWKAFQLNPGLKTQPDKRVDEYLAEIKNLSLEKARSLNDHVTKLAAEVGLEYHFDKAIVANSFNAHRLSHFAKSKGLQLKAEEMLFLAYFTEGKNIDDLQTLAAIGASVGLDKSETLQILAGKEFTEEVIQDLNEAQHLGIRGVPFFVFDRKYAVSGAQESQVFLNSLEEAYAEWQQENSFVQEVKQGPTCNSEGECSD